MSHLILECSFNRLNWWTPPTPPRSSKVRDSGILQQCKHISRFIAPQYLTKLPNSQNQSVNTALETPTLQRAAVWSIVLLSQITKWRHDWKFHSRWQLHLMISCFQRHPNLLLRCATEKGTSRPSPRQTCRAIQRAISP